MATALGSAPVSAVQPGITAAGRGWGTPQGEASARAVDNIRSAMAGKHLLEASRALGVDAPVLPALEVPRVVAAELEALPAAARKPVLRLWAATRQADAVLGSVSGRRLRTLQRRLFDSERSSAATTPRTTVPSTPSQRDAAVATVFAALDDTLPALSAGSLLATDRSADSCDALDLRPQLCIGSEADNVHREDAVLVLDLGGNDRYENGAGAAPFRRSETAPHYGLLSVNVDLSGNDTYTGDTAPPASIWGSAWTYGQGAGLLGGVGVLVDAAGNDVYRAAAQFHLDPAVGDGLPRWLGGLLAQGAGAAGTGWLVDLAGSDTYDSAVSDETHVTGPVSRGLRLAAQGAAQQSPACGGGPSVSDPADSTPPQSCSQGALLDLGESADSYDVHARLPEDNGSGPDGDDLASVYAQGASGQQGMFPGTLYDGGGDDALSVDVELPWDTRPGTEGTQSATVHAQGSSHARLIAGTGDTTYSVAVRESDVQGAGYTEVLAQAASGVLDDAGGDDVYRLDVHRSSQEHRVVGGVCEPGPSCAGGRPAVIDATGRTPRILAQGASFTDNGLLRDRGGNDHYSAVGSTAMDVALTQSSAQQAPPFFAKALPDPQLYAQGYGKPLNYAAELRDDAGTDSYEAHISNYLRIDGPVGDGSHMVAFLQGAAGLVAGQGAGNGGTLADLGGADDRFVMSADRDVTGPPGLTKYFGLLRVPSGQGDGRGAFVALGERPVIQTRPAAAVCGGDPGYRGYGVWTTGQPTTCAAEAPEDEAHHAQDTGGLGYAPGAELAQPSKLVVATDSSEPKSARLVDDDTQLRSAPLAVDATAMLTNATGAPLSNRVVHFTLQCVVIGPTDGDIADRAWLDRWTVDAVTDESGRAHASVPVEFPEWYMGQRGWGEYRWQILAWSDGDPGTYYPARAAVPVSIVEGSG